MVVTLALARSNLETLYTFANAVSNPTSPQYTQYNTTHELAQATAPSAEAAAAVSSWLSSHDVVHSVQPVTQAVTAHMTVAKAQSLFGPTKFHELQCRSSECGLGTTAIVGDSVSVPQSIRQHLEAVFGIHGLPLPARSSRTMQQPTATAPSVKPVLVTPSVIRHVYNVSGVTPSGSLTNRQAVAEFVGQLVSQTDLTQFFAKYVPDAPPGADKIYKFVNDTQQGQGGEANLDIQYLMGVAPGIKTEAWQYSNTNFCSGMKQWTQQVIATGSSGPNVFSVSYCWQAPMELLGCTQAQVESIDRDLATIAASGVTVVVGSGDSGAGYYKGLLYAGWPTSSQWVTSVGGTTFIEEDNPSAGQRATLQFGSGGGFSRLQRPQPEWQQQGVATFMARANASTLPPTKLYGAGGRATPDVATLAENYQVILGGAVTNAYGTSAATPTWAALVSLLNEARAQSGSGLGPMGSMAHWLWQHTSALTDVVVGNDRIMRSGAPNPDHLGFDCEQGWDPVSGWGVPDFAKLLKAALTDTRVGAGEA